MPVAGFHWAEASIPADENKFSAEVNHLALIFGAGGSSGVNVCVHL
jgi:hypothetical protein